MKILQGDCRDILPTMEPESIQCCVTSPPYWGLRDYGCEGQLGLEPTPEEYIANMVRIFREVGRVMKYDGTLWLNLGDSYCSQGGSHDGRSHNQPGVGANRVWRDGAGRADGIVDERGQRNRNGNCVPGLRPKNLIGIPWRVALALQANGWYLRSDIIWHKPNPMPESVTDRPTRAHEYIFLFSKQERYFYDAKAIEEPSTSDHPSGNGYKRDCHLSYQDKNGSRGSDDHWTKVGGTRNKRSVWTVATQPYTEAHFATFPEDLIKPCIMAGSRFADTVLDPFAGSGTACKVAIELGRDAIGIELNPAYVSMIRDRTNVTVGML